MHLKKSCVCLELELSRLLAACRLDEDMLDMVWLDEPVLVVAAALAEAVGDLVAY
jgi:hypothetical protein